MSATAFRWIEPVVRLRNGVDHCETGADRPHFGGIAAGGYVLFEDPDLRVGFGTSDGTRKQVECQCP